MTSMRVVLVLLALGMAACAPTAARTPAATLRLIDAPPTATPTATAEPPLPAPGDLITVAAPAAETSAVTIDGIVVSDPSAAEMVVLAQQRLAENLDLPVRRIQLVDVQPVTWTDSSLGCPQSDTAYAPVLVDGYRIVLMAGETEYFFHTDFDRLVPCDAEDEVLPEGTAIAEATEE